MYHNFLRYLNSLKLLTTDVNKGLKEGEILLLILFGKLVSFDHLRNVNIMFYTDNERSMD